MPSTGVSTGVGCSVAGAESVGSGAAAVAPGAAGDTDRVSGPPSDSAA